jgi:hypothetical protein
MFSEIIDKVMMAKNDVVNEIYNEGMTPDDFPSDEFNEMILDKMLEVDIGNGVPYNTIKVEGNTYDDYALSINGRSFELSICRETRTLTINKFGE